MNNKNRGFAPIIILVIIFVAAVGVAFYVTKTRGLFTKTGVIVSSPTPVPTTGPMSSWKTYTSVPLGLSMSYPDNVTFTHIPTAQEKAEEIRFSYPDSYLQIEIGCAPDNKSAAKEVAGNIEFLGRSYAEYNFFNLTPYSYQIYFYSDKLPFQNCLHIIKAFKIKTMDAQPVFDQILSTFKFIQ